MLIVLSVIIVGIAVAVGITMFNAQATSANRQAILSDMNQFAAQALAFYKTPSNYGGGDNSWTSDPLNVGLFLGYNYNETTDQITTENGIYTFSVSADVLTITGVGNETGNDGSNSVQATMQITGSTHSINTTINN